MTPSFNNRAMKYLLYAVWLVLLATGCVSHSGYVLTGNVPEDGKEERWNCLFPT